MHVLNLEQASVSTSIKQATTGFTVGGYGVVKTASHGGINGPVV